MHQTQTVTPMQREIQTPARNRYFYGKLLDVYHFELETNYHNAKRWLINRLVLGYGVVCGLDVTRGAEPYTVKIMPGMAIDKWGREIIITEPVEQKIPEEFVPGSANSRPLPNQNYKQQSQPPEEKRCVQVMLCYHECESDPAPVLAGDCQTADPCAPSVIREKYRIKFTDECENPPRNECQIPDIVDGGRINYAALATWVTRGGRECLTPPEDPCLRLAHVYFDADSGHCHDDDIDITVRPIVYTNDLLFEILLGWQREDHPNKYAK